VVLVAMTLAAIALTRTVYTSNMVAGNLAFQQAATHSADAGVEAAVAWLENNNGQATSSSASTCTSGSSVLACPQTAWGYSATRQDPGTGESWSTFWDQIVTPNGMARTLSADAAGNTVAYVIQRMCSIAGDSQLTNNDCAVAPGATAGTCSGGSSCDAQRVNLNSVSQVYYRITVRVAGPRNTVSFVQSIVAL
jgi:type IV pilus assembly protein PilX